MKKTLFGLIFILFVSIGLYAPQQVSAKAALHVEAEIGIENRVKREMPTFINVTITNNGDPFSGDFVVDTETRYNVGSAHVYPLDIATGETKTLEIYVDGFSDRYTYTTPIPDLFHFYDGGIEKGKKMKYEGDHFVSPRLFEPYTTMGLVVTTNKDEVSSLNRIDTFVSDGVELFYVNSKDNAYLAEDARALEMLDLIIFDDIAVHDLSEKQQQALYTWVQQGGKIVFTVNDIGSQAAGVFEKELPLQVSSDKINVPIDAFKKYVTTDAQVDPIAVYNATLTDGAKEKLKLNETIIAGTKSVGKGEVVQLAFPLNDPVITKLSGYGRLIVDILQLDMMQNYSSGMLTYGFAPDWTHTNELFETFKINVWLLMGGIIVYIAIIGPVLYMLLKRKDKREKMWIYVPILAILTSLLFFVFGARDRLFNPQIEQMAMFEVQEDGTLFGSFSNALLSNRTGDFTYQVEQGTSAAASTNSGVGTSELHLKSYVKQTAEGQQLTLRDIGYWSVQSVVGETVLPEAGKLLTDLTLKNGVITGSVTNNLPVDLKDVAILSGNDEIVLGSIKAGETLQVNEETKKQYFAKPYYYDPYSYSMSNTLSILETKKERFKSSAIYANELHNGPILVGWSDVSLIPIELDANAKQNTISYFVKVIQPKVEISGEISFTEEDIIPALGSEDGNSYGHIEENDINKAYISEGNHEVYYDFVSSEELKTMNWKELEVDYDDSVIEVEIYNHQTQEYTKLENGKLKLTENVADYLVEELYLQLRFKVSRIGIDDGEYVKLPAFKLKGEPNQ